MGVTGGAALVAFGPGAVLTAALVGASAGAISGYAGKWIESQITGEKVTPQDYINAAVAGAVGGAVAGVVGLGGSALGLSPVLTGVMSGFSVGATQQVATNLMPPAPGKPDAPWYAGVAESAIIGAAAGGVAGGIVGAANPQSLPAKVLVGGVAGGGVGGGMKIATNVAAGRPWNEDLGQAIAIGATTGMVDAFTDYYGDMLVERAMTPRSARGAVDDVDAWRRPGDVDDAGSMLFEPGEGKRWVNYGFEAEWHPKRLVPLDAPDGPRKVPSTGGRANEGRYRWAAGSVDAEGTKIGGRFAPGDAPGDALELDWRQQRWQSLREQYGIPEDAQMVSIYDVELWEGPARQRIWLGTKDASGVFDSQGNKIPFPGGYRGEGGIKGPLLRQGVADADAELLLQAYDLPPRKYLGGMTGEDASLRFGGDISDRLKAMIDYTAINDGEIMFVLHENVIDTEWTLFELQHILSDPENLLSRTKFIIDWYY